MDARAKRGDIAKSKAEGATAQRAAGDQVRSLVRALGVLNRIAETPGGLTLTDLAQQAGLATSTTHRLLTTLEQERYVRFTKDKRTWTIGVQAFITGRTYPLN